MSKQSKEAGLSNEVNKEIKSIINEIFGLGKTSSEKEAEDAENAKEGETWLPIWKELPEPYHSFFTLYVKFMESNDMKLDTERKTKIAELFRDRSDSAVRVVGGEMCSVGDPWMAALKDIADKYSYNLPPNCLTGDSSGDGGGGEDPDPSKDDCPEGQVRDPETGECVDGGETETTTTGGDGPVPIFKDMRVKDPETGKMARVGAKEGGQGLQALLANWLAKNAPGEVDKKALQQAAGRLVKAVAAQLKANNIEIQENQIHDYVRSLLAEMKTSIKEAASAEAAIDPDYAPEPETPEKGADVLQFPDKGEAPSAEEMGEELTKLSKYLEKRKKFYGVAKDLAGEGMEDEEVIEFGKDALDDLGVPALMKEAKLQAVRKGLETLYKKGNYEQAAKTVMDLLRDATKNFKKIYKKIIAGDASADNLRNHMKSYVIRYDLGKDVIENYKKRDDEPEEPEPEPEEPREPTELSGDVVLDSLQARLKELDLDTTEGRYGASEPGNDQAYLGAYMFYKAMKNVLKKLKENPNAPTQALIQAAGKELSGNEYGTGSPYSPKRTGAVNEEEGEVGELEKWLGDIIQTFEREGLADAKRAVKASREARGADKCPNGQGKDPETGECVNNFSDDDTQEPMTVFGAEKCREMPDCMEKWKDKVASLLNDPDARTTAAAGTINTKQIVAPQLKSAGIDLNSPEGQKFTKSLEKVVRRFLKRHLQRLGKEDIKLIAENEEHMNKLADIVRLYTEKLLNERRKQND